jgi:hypothetical protein
MGVRPDAASLLQIQGQSIVKTPMAVVQFVQGQAALLPSLTAPERISLLRILTTAFQMRTDVAECQRLEVAAIALLKAAHPGALPAIVEGIGGLAYFQDHINELKSIDLRGLVLSAAAPGGRAPGGRAAR